MEEKAKRKKLKTPKAVAMVKDRKDMERLKA